MTIIPRTSRNLKSLVNNFGIYRHFMTLPLLLLKLGCKLACQNQQSNRYTIFWFR